MEGIRRLKVKSVFDAINTYPERIQAKVAKMVRSNSLLITKKIILSIFYFIVLIISPVLLRSIEVYKFSVILYVFLLFVDFLVYRTIYPKLTFYLYFYINFLKPTPSKPV